MDNKIRQARRKYGLTQEQMSHILNIPIRTLQNWENNVNRCSPYTQHFILARLEDRFERPDYRTFLIEFLQMMESDLGSMNTAECKQYTCGLISQVKQFLL